MEGFIESVTKVLGNSWVQSAIVVIIAAIIYRIIAVITIRGEKREKLKKVKGKTYLRLIRNITKYVILDHLRNKRLCTLISFQSSNYLEIRQSIRVSLSSFH